MSTPPGAPETPAQNVPESPAPEASDTPSPDARILHLAFLTRHLRESIREYFVAETGYTEIERHLFGIYQTDPAALSTVTFYPLEDEELDTKSEEER